ncbi:MAG: 4-hydroxy-3-methylbut-2-enyl diphosphate reductase [Christensenellaceae bacterium]|nr:4-hydroxy-3-methylbut-2-enyl diphosphate reductase [Christensenellaceae bacterium]
MEIVKTKFDGFCKGVSRAVTTALDSGVGTYVLGNLVHNEIVMKTISDRGLVTVGSDDEIPSGAKVIIRAHGVGKSVYERLKQKNCEIIDCTCPFVKKIHGIVSEYSSKGFHIIVFGDKNHAEVKGTIGWTNGDYTVVGENDEFDEAMLREKNAIVAQTTFSRQKLENFLKNIKKNDKKRVEIFKTICYTTIERQKEAIDIADSTDAVIVIGSKTSNNTAELLNLVSSREKECFLVSEVADLKNVKTNFKKVGIVCGASTPHELIQEVFLNMENNTEVKALNEMEEAVAKMDEQSTKFRKGQTITATISSATDEGLALYINNTKKEIVLPKEELITNAYNKDDYKDKIGEEIEVMIVGLNPVKLSEKAIAQLKEEEETIKSIEEGNTFNVTVDGFNKGGLTGKIGSYGVFIPSSQIRIGFVKDLEKYVGKTLRCKMEKIEKNERRKQIVASQRVILEAEKAERDAAKAAKEEAFFSAISVGDIIKGTVVRFAQFGAFVDVNGFDCLAHISDLSWTNIKNCGEVLELNKEYEFKILSIDTEKKKVSLGYKQLQPKPWDLVGEKYNVGDVVKGTVVRITKFGAFVEVEKGVDGLVHVSQISHEWLENPTTAVQVGQEVEVKILGIDTENEKMTLSIKALQPVPEGLERPNRQRREKNNEGHEGEEKPARERKPRREKTDDDEIREWNEGGEGGASIAELLGGNN